MAPLATISSASVIDGAIQRNMLGRAGKGITLVDSNKDGVSYTVKNEIEKQQGGFLGMYFKCFNVMIVMRVGKSVAIAGWGYNDIGHTLKNYFYSSLKNIEI